MGDVAGKGLAGASMVGRLRSALRAYALEGHDGARVVERLNRLLWTEAEESQMATMLYVIVDPAASAVRWVNAGHPPPLLITDGEPRFLEGAGSVPLGVLPFPTYEEVVGAAGPGQHAPALHGRPGRAARRAHRRRHGASWRRACARRPRTRRPLRPPARRRSCPRAGRTDDVALLTLRNLPVPDHFSAEFPAEPESLAPMREHAAALAQPRRGGRARDRRDHDGLRRGGHERDRARGHERRRRFEVSGSRNGARGRDRRARPRLLAERARGRPRPRARPDADADGYGCGGAQSGGHDR